MALVVAALGMGFVGMAGMVPAVSTEMVDVLAPVRDNPSRMGRQTRPAARVREAVLPGR
jgi:hypothetical protein